MTDIYKLNSDNVKICSRRISEKFSPLGRTEKDILKHYYDYSDSSSLKKLISVAGITNENKQVFIDIVEGFRSDYSKKAVECFKKNFSVAEENNDKIKKFDYLYSLYKKLTFLLHPDKISLHEIYEYNKSFIQNELNQSLTEKIRIFCENNEKIKPVTARHMFCDFYQNILDEDLINKSRNGELEKLMNTGYSSGTPFENIDTEKIHLIVFNINQELDDIYGNCGTFTSAVLSIINQTYRILKNHRVIAFKIDNIFTESGHNIKWELYSYIGIYAEHFIPLREKRRFYKREQLCYERCEYRQEDEIKFISNKNQLVFIFNKYRHDDRKIPCPDCAGLNISGNSFPEVGLRSWECKNTICPSRSKSNRGKRYSYRSNFMQRGVEENTDIISKDLIKKWRRDIADSSDDSEIFDMLFQYFCFSGENILLINAENIKINDFSKFNVSHIKLNQISSMPIESSLFRDYFVNGNYVKRYMPEKNLFKNNYPKKNVDFSKTPAVIATGNSMKVLESVEDNTFSCAVTSPPYYNARLYSQWSNMYNYLSDMYKTAQQVFRTMKPGGVYLYNIGDICGNENTVVNSNMGKKRILLGAYTIQIFLSIGFELLENILWDKGEPQSNRQKNDGKFTPFYQRPMNVYEHMFLFKKPGKLIVNPNKDNCIDKKWTSNIVSLMPVFKINSKGENTLGHTAPFPEDIPDFLIKTFTRNSNDIVLEPFAGSGTSLISAGKNNRKCFRIELSEEYVELIKKRCDNENINIMQI